MSRSMAWWKETGPLARKCLQHPFVQGLGDGTLDPDRYRRFIAQDAFFLEAFARGYAHCLANSPDRDGLYAFRRLLDGVFDELRLHARVSKEMGINLETVSPLPATLEYTSFLQQAISSSADIGETLAAMTPCMRLYAYLGAKLAEEPVEDNRYAAWIQTYAGHDFQELAGLIEGLLDHHGTGSEREHENYRRAMELELQFFESAYGGV